MRATSLHRIHPVFDAGDVPTGRVLPVFIVFAVHHLIAHPLLVLWPRLGRWLHQRTIAAHDYTFCEIWADPTAADEAEASR